MGSYKIRESLPILLLSFSLAFLSLVGPGIHPAIAQGSPQEPSLDVPWEPSEDAVVAEMLKIAEVNKGDILYDLGCGDGRIVIQAAKEIGVRGIGIDLDPKRIQESMENARRAKVTDRVQFKQQNLFDAHISEATVVMLYLWPEVNLRLRPKLFRELKPGTRIVLHSHNMGKWKPDRSIVAPNGHSVYFWVMPANASGTWEWGLKGGKTYTLKLEQKFQEVTGTINAGASQAPVKELTLKGDLLQFTLDDKINGRPSALHFEGRIGGNTLQGSVEALESGKRDWQARRDPSSITSPEKKDEE